MSNVPFVPNWRVIGPDFSVSTSLTCTSASASRVVWFSFGIGRYVTVDHCIYLSIETSAEIQLMQTRRRKYRDEFINVDFRNLCNTAVLCVGYKLRTIGTRSFIR